MFCRISLFTSALCLLQLSTAQLLCYYPNGRQSPDVPCNISAPVSMCCGSAKACLSNGLCMLDDTTEASGVSYARGSCTDAQWTSNVCPRQCLLNQDSPNNSSAYDFRSSGVQVWECGDQRGYGTEANYCCESDSEKTRCCSTSAAVFKLPAATIGNALNQVLTATSSSTSSSASTAVDSTSVGGSTGTAAQTASLQTSTDGPDDSMSSSGPSIGAIVGIALGVGLVFGVLALGVAVFFYRRRRKSSIGVQREIIYEKGKDAQEISGQGVYEMDGMGRPAEMAGDDRRHELATSRRDMS